LLIFLRIIVFYDRHQLPEAFRTNAAKKSSGAMKKELVLEIIKERWSPYALSSLPAEEFKIKAMMEAAGHAPSCFNEQPWLFV